MIIAVFTIIGFLTMIGYLISDILYAVVDQEFHTKNMEQNNFSLKVRLESV